VELSELLPPVLWFLLSAGLLALLLSALAGAAFRVNLANNPWPLDAGDFIWRCLLAGAVLALYLVIAYYCTFVPVGTDAAGVFWILVAPYPLIAPFVLSWAFALDDPMEGLKIFVLQHIVPVLLLLAVAWFSAPVSQWLRSLSPWS
jgi:hypothetical protein